MTYLTQASGVNHVTSAHHLNETDHSVDLAEKARRDAKFWDKIAAKYARKPVPDEAIYQRKLELTREYLTRDLNVLEFGCGTGSTALAHAPHVKTIRATDISSEMISIARDKAVKSGTENVVFETASVEQLAQERQSYDAVLALSILHLVDDLDETLAMVARSLEPGGVFVSSTACINDGMSFIMPFLKLGKVLGLVPTVKALSSQSLIERIEAHGFDIELEWVPTKRAGIFLIAKKR